MRLMGILTHVRDDPNANHRRQKGHPSRSFTYVDIPPIMDDSLLPDESGLETKASTQQTENIPTLGLRRDAYVSQLNKPSSLVVLCDESMPEFCQEMVKTPEGYMRLLNAANRARWIHYQISPQGTVFWMEPGLYLKLSKGAVGYLKEKYEITTYNLKNPEVRKEVLVLAGLDDELIPKKDGTQAKILSKRRGKVDVTFVGSLNDLDGTVYGVEMDSEKTAYQNMFSSTEINPRGSRHSLREFMETVSALLKGQLHPQPINYAPPD